MSNKKTEYVPYNFLGINDSKLDYDSAKAVILPIPYDGTVSYRAGARDGASAIINASRFVELYDADFNQNISDLGIFTLGELESKIDNPENMVNHIYTAAAELVKNSKFLIGLGGEHTVSVGLVRAHKEKYDNLTVLQFDAHADLRYEYWGSKYSHACTMRRIIEDVPIVQVGIRSFCEEDFDVIKKENIPVITSEEIIVNKETWMGRIVDGLSQNVYITLDLDVFDPSIMSATGTPEPGGLDWYTILNIIKTVSTKKNIVGFDIVELSPIPGNIAPDFMSAKLCYKMIGYSLLK